MAASDWRGGGKRGGLLRDIKERGQGMTWEVVEAEAQGNLQELCAIPISRVRE